MTKKEKIRLFESYRHWSAVCCTYIGRKDAASKAAYNHADIGASIAMRRILEADLFEELREYTDSTPFPLGFFDVCGNFVCRQ